MTKFAIAPGKGEFQTRLQLNKGLGKTKVPNGLNMSVFVYLDDDWDKVRSLETCEEKAQYSKLSKTIQVPLDGSWSDFSTGFLNQKLRTHVWFFVLADCNNTLSQLPKANRVNWELEVFNSDGSHFSQEEHGMISPLLIVLTVIVGFFITNSIKFYKFYRTEESLDYPTLIITVSLFLELLSLVFQISHYWIFSIDGKGSTIFSFAGQALGIASQFLITCLLLLMAYGWSIKFFRFEEMDLVIPLGIVLGLMHIFIVGLGRVNDDESYRYHNYENWAGMMVMGLRVLLFGFWLYLYRETYKSTGKESEKSFFGQFGVLSSLYFMAVPAVVFFATMVVAPYWRHKFVTAGTLLLQTLTLIIFTLLFTTKSNKYYQISMKGKTILPSNKLA